MSTQHVNIDLNKHDKFEGTKGVIRSHKSGREYNGQKDKMTNNDLQKNT